MLKFASEPLLLPSCPMAVVPLGDATCVSSGVVPFSTFQLKVWLEAPSAKFVMGMAATSPRVNAVVGTVIVSPVANAVDPALIVRSTWLDVNGVPTVAVPSAPETEPETLNVVALVAVNVMVWGTAVEAAARPETVPFPTLDPP
jgi:hypothetical protein